MLLSPTHRALSTLLAGVASGGLLALATCQLGLGLLAFVALVPLLFALDRVPPLLVAGAAGWFCGAVFFGLALAWIPTAGHPAAVLALLAGYVVALATGLALVTMLLAWLRRGDRRLFLLSAPLLWVGYESLRAAGAFGYPWHQLAVALADHPGLIQLAAYLGTLGLSLWIAAVNVGIVWLPSARHHTTALATAALMLAPLALAPRAFTTVDSSDELRIAVVQPAIREPGHASSEAFRANLATLLELTRRVGRDEPDLVVWPESAFERPIYGNRELLLQAIAHDAERPLLTGAWRRDDAHGLYNSAVLASADGQLVVVGDKVHPVLLYERAASSYLERWLEGRGLWWGRFNSGNEPGLFSVRDRRGAEVPLGVLVCFDSSYGELALSLRARGAQALIEISNEAQTTAWTARHHARIARLRAVESGLPLVRVANTGPSEWVDAFGRVVAQLPEDTPHAATRPIALTSVTPLYAELGDIPVQATAAALVLAAVVRRSLTQGEPPDEFTRS